MRNATQMWNLGTAAELYGCRPSVMLGVDDPLAAYQFDQAVAFLVGYVRSAYYDERNRDRKTGAPLKDIGQIVSELGQALKERRSLKSSRAGKPADNYERATRFALAMGARVIEVK